MGLPTGVRLGSYEITAQIGAGGMGEVYRATDITLKRQVAVKVLPAALANDADRLARFQREAEVLAALNHPHIAQIYGVETLPDEAGRHARGADGGHHTRALIIELVEGPTLADRIAQGPIPVDAALAIAAQIAGALEAAHEQGIVHRDLKPANVKITSAGIVKVLDFGLAKILAEPDEAATVAPLTRPMVLLGTPAYMAPEQAEGKAAGTGVDVWAFGIVLYEMVTGERPFQADSLHGTLAAIRTVDLRWDRVPPEAQPLVRACLERDPRARLRSIGDYRFLLRSSPAAPVAAPRSQVWKPLAAMAALGLIMLAFFAGWSSRGDVPPRETPIRLSTMLPEGVSVTRGPGYTSSVTVSPDGRTVVIAASDKDGQRLYRRSLDQLDPLPLAGTERGSSPFFSWDGAWIGFFADGRLKRIPADGGTAVDIADAPGFSAGASWGADERIVFAYGADPQLRSVPADGGVVELLGDGVPGRHPDVLPDGRVLFESAGQISAFDRRTGVTTRLLPGSAPRFADGRVIFSRGSTLLAASIDLTNLMVGRPVALGADVAVELPGSGGGRHYAVGRSGALAYVPAAASYELVLVGATERVVGEPQRSLENPRFSPDGRYVVVAARRRDDEATGLWLHDLAAGTATRLTSGNGRAPVWNEDGRTITYSQIGEGQGIYSTHVDGAGDATRLLALDTFHWLVGWTADRTLLFGQMLANSRSSILAHTGAGTRTLVGPGSTWGGRLSRDGRWLAYYVLNAGTFEVYVTPMPDASRRWLIAEGTDPSWGPDGNEIYYRSGPRLMAARIDKTSGIKVLTSRIVVDPFLPPLYDDYDIHRDGRTLVMVRPANRTQGREITLVLDWSGELRQEP